VTFASLYRYSQKYVWPTTSISTASDSEELGPTAPGWSMLTAAGRASSGDVAFSPPRAPALLSAAVTPPMASTPRTW
jgi:hypothetical protein